MDDDAEFEEQLRRVTEESLRHYEQVEIPRILSQQPAASQVQPGTSRSFNKPENVRNPEIPNQNEPQEKKTDNDNEWDDMVWEDAAFETAIQRHLEHDDVPKTVPTDLDATLSTLERGEQAPGFHRDAGRAWIFPTDFPERRYQFDICQTALFHDTLVCLPTGLGKTFIAAVVMYNVYRWFPRGAVVFLAPTRPLVTQQVNACQHVAGLPVAHTAELTGSINPATRRELWQHRRVFFMTPQTLANDLQTGIADPERIRCVVLDEAHRARGAHAYVQLVRAIRARNRCFRLLALSATPGANLQTVKEVLKELGISRVEARSEESPEIAEYTHRREIETIVLPLGEELTQFKQRLFSVVDEFSRILRQRRLVQAANLTKFGVLKASLAFRARPGPRDNAVESEFAMTLALCQAAELLCHHGLRAFHNNLAGVLSDPTKTRISNRLRTSEALARLMEDAAARLGDDDVRQRDIGTQACASDASKPYECTHPKMKRLVQLVVEHLQRCHDQGHSSRVMVFCQYRDVVTEVRHALEQHRPLVRPVYLIGQAGANATAGANGANTANKGQTQKQQREVLRKFSDGGNNVLICTCVGEEGLDIGEVDLIVCYEPHASPIRLVQRMGRTGRKRDGRVVMLITQGREQQKYQQSLTQGGAVLRQLLRADLLKDALCQNAPSFLPAGVYPVVMRMSLAPPPPPVAAVAVETEGRGKAKAKGQGKGAANQDLRVMMAKKVLEKESVFASREEMVSLGALRARLAEPVFLHASSDRDWDWDREEDPDEGRGTDLGRWIEWQRLEQDATVARHSSLTRDLVNLLQFTGSAQKDVSMEIGVFSQLSPHKKQNIPASETSPGRDANPTQVQPSIPRQRGSNPTESWCDAGFEIPSTALPQQPKQQADPAPHWPEGAEQATHWSEGTEQDAHADCATCRALAGIFPALKPIQLRPQLRSVSLDPSALRGLFSRRGLLDSALKLGRPRLPPQPSPSLVKSPSPMKSTPQRTLPPPKSSPPLPTAKHLQEALPPQPPPPPQQETDFLDGLDEDMFADWDDVGSKAIELANTERSPYKTDLAKNPPHQAGKPKSILRKTDSLESDMQKTILIDGISQRASLTKNVPQMAEQSVSIPPSPALAQSVLNSNAKASSLIGTCDAEDRKEQRSRADEESMYSVEQLLEKLGAAHPPVDRSGVLSYVPARSPRPPPNPGPGTLPAGTASASFRLLPDAFMPKTQPLEKSPPTASETPDPGDISDLLAGFNDMSDLELSPPEARESVGPDDRRPETKPCGTPPSPAPQTEDLLDLLSGFNDPIPPRGRLKLARPRPTRHSTPKGKDPRGWKPGHAVLSPILQSPMGLGLRGVNAPSCSAKQRCETRRPANESVGRHQPANESSEKLHLANESCDRQSDSTACTSNDSSTLAPVARPVMRLDSSESANEDAADSSGAEFATPTGKGKGPGRKKGRGKQRRQIEGRRRKCRFVDSEAESSGRDSSDGENTSGLDEYDASFVDDVSPGPGGGATQYLRPLHTPSPPPQAPPLQHASYLEDSFVVKDVEEPAAPTQLSPLSLAELRLKQRRRRRRHRQDQPSQERKPRKRRRIRSPSPDETLPPVQAASNQQIFSQILADFDWTQGFPFDDISALGGQDKGNKDRQNKS